METGEKHKKVGCMNNIAKTVAKCTKWPWVKILKSDNYAENFEEAVLLHAAPVNQHFLHSYQSTSTILLSTSK